MKGMWLIVVVEDGVTAEGGGWRGTPGHFWFYMVVKSSLAKMLATAPQNESERWGTQTPDTLIKS